MEEMSTFFAILTADVRYSEKINANEKLLYAEITALTNRYGYCWASNDYFAKAFKCSPQAISKWIKNLKDNGFISCEYIYKDNSKEISKRVIKLGGLGIHTDSIGIHTGSLGIHTGLKGYTHRIKDNINIINNNINNSIDTPKFNFRNSLISYGFNKDLVSDWLEVRKGKRSANTETAYKSFIKEIETRECNINEILEHIIIKSWVGFKWSWYDNEMKSNNNLSINNTKQQKQDELTRIVTQFRIEEERNQ